MAKTKLWVRGVLAGVVGATVLAVWFLIVDAAHGSPFRTPAFLAASLVAVEGLETRPVLISLYTILHYAAFVGIGLGVVWLLEKLETAPSVLLGLVLGFVLFDIVFFASVYITGVDLVDELGWVEVLAGNLFAGIFLMGTLRMTGVVRPVPWWEALASHQMLREGVVTGVMGALAVAAWFFVVDLVQGRLFFTPGALGSALFLGAGDLDAIQVSIWTVLGYTLFHVGAFLAVGIVAAALVWQAEEAPPLFLAGILMFVTFQAFFLGLLAVVAEFLLQALSLWTIGIANLLAVAAMGYYLWRKHPKLRAVLSDDPLDLKA